MRYTISLACASLAATSPALAEVPRVMTDIPPVQSLAAQVLGDLGSPGVLLEAGANAHDFQLRPSQVAELAEAGLVIWVGPEMTPWLDRTLNGLSDGGARLGLLASAGTVTRAFGQVADKGHAEEGHDHAHEGHDHAEEAAHDHSAKGHDHAGEGHDHTGEGRDHAGEGHDHTGEGHDHAGEGHDHTGEGRDHAGEGHDHAGEGHDHVGEGHDHAGEGHDHTGEGHDHAGEGHDHTGEGHDHAAEGHDHAEEGHDHAHDGIDPHAWLDPANAQVWLAAIAAELSRIDPDNAAVYAANAAAAADRVAALDAEIAAQLQPVADRPFVVFHDAYGYFADHYGLTVAGAIALGDAASPGAAHLKALQAGLAAGQALCIFPEANHDPKLVEVMAEGTGVKVGGALDPEGSSLDPGPGLYSALLSGMVETLTACLADG